MEGNYGATDSDGSTYHGYHIIIFCISPYTLKYDLSIDGQVMYSDVMVCEITYFFSININSN